MSGRLLSEIRVRIAPLSGGLYRAAKRLAYAAPRGCALGQWWRVDPDKWTGAVHLDGRDLRPLSARQAREMLAKLVQAGIIERDGRAIRFISDELAGHGLPADARRDRGGSPAEKRRKRGGFIDVSDCDVIEICDKTSLVQSRPPGAATALSFEGEAAPDEREILSAAGAAAILVEFGFLTGRHAPPALVRNG